MITVRQQFFRIFDDKHIAHTLESNEWSELFVCGICGESEAGLMKNCPGEMVTHEEGRLIYKLYLDKTYVGPDATTIKEYNEAARKLNDMILDGVLIDLDIYI